MGICLPHPPLSDVIYFRSLTLLGYMDDFSGTVKNGNFCEQKDVCYVTWAFQSPTSFCRYNCYSIPLRYIEDLFSFGILYFKEYTVQCHNKLILSQKDLH